MIDKNTDTYYEELFDMFSKPGYETLISELRESVKTIEDMVIRGKLTNDELREKRGEILAMKRVIMYEPYIREVYKQLQNGEEDASV